MVHTYGQIYPLTHFFANGQPSAAGDESTCDEAAGISANAAFLVISCHLRVSNGRWLYFLNLHVEKAM